MGTSWTLALKQAFKYFGTGKISQIFSYFQIPFSQWRGSAIKKSNFEVFFKAWGNLVVCKIWSLYDNQICDGNTFLQYLNSFFYQSGLEFSDFDKKWAKTRPLLLKILELPISIA